MKYFLFAPIVLFACTSTTPVHKLTQFDPVTNCEKFRTCYEKKYGETPQEMFNNCVKANKDIYKTAPATMKAIIDVSYTDCKDLKPCGYAVCMTIHGQCKVAHEQAREQGLLNQ